MIGVDEDPRLPPPRCPLTHGSTFPVRLLREPQFPLPSSMLSKSLNDFALDKRDAMGLAELSAHRLSRLRVPRELTSGIT
jgi:hypothetical protein